MYMYMYMSMSMYMYMYMYLSVFLSACLPAWLSVCLYIHTYITSHHITLHCTTLHYTTLHYITLHYIHTHTHMWGSINGGSPNWLVYNVKSTKQICFRGTTILGNLHISACSLFGSPQKYMIFCCMAWICSITVFTVFFTVSGAKGWVLAAQCSINSKQN